MKRKYRIFILILIVIESFSIVSFVNCFSYKLISLNTNQKEYYIDDIIKINASWELIYNDNNEIAYTQIHIIDKFNQFIWNSSKYNQIGTFEKNWTVNIKDLNLDIDNGSYILYVKFFLYYCLKETGGVMNSYLESIEIKVMKRNISCELVGYREQIKIGESLSLLIKFYDEAYDINQYLINQNILFMISFDDFIIHQSNYTTNMSGVINIHLNSLTQLRLGQNFLIFSMIDNKVYNDSKFIFEIQVDKNNLMIDVLNFSNNLEKGEDLKIKLHCYYYLNQSNIDLANKTLLIKIFNNQSLAFVNSYKTDQYGFLEASISQNSFNFPNNSHDFIIQICFNETTYLDNKVLTLNLNLAQDYYSQLLASFYTKVFSFISVLIIILVFLSYVIINKRSKNEKLLTELIIRY